MKYTIKPFHDHAICISFGDDVKEEYLYFSKGIISALAKNPPIGYIEAIPGYNNLTIIYDPIKIANEYLTSNMQHRFITEIEKLLKHIDTAKHTNGETITIPVCYGSEFGPDLEYVAATNNLSIEEVIRIHSEAIYTVHMIGFAPGFPFLGGMDPRIATPRKKTPATAIPAGSVGIAGIQTGIYPIETPGGWQIIGKTPIALFQPTNMHSPSKLSAGDRLKFHPITEEEFREMEADNDD